MNWHGAMIGFFASLGVLAIGTAGGAFGFLLGYVTERFGIWRAAMLLIAAICLSCAVIGCLTIK